MASTTATAAGSTDGRRLTGGARVYAGGGGVPTPSASDERREGQGRAPILVVERDPHVRELEAHFLAAAGFAAEFVADGEAALASARRLCPDLVITEILVPKMDGLALCRTLKNDPATAGVSVLVFSILAATARAREAGADAFLMKPLAERRLVDTVQMLLDRRGGAAKVPNASPTPAPESA